MRIQTYEVMFAGEAGGLLGAEFEDCEVTIGSGMTTLRADVPDGAAFAGLIRRIADLRLQVVHVHLVAPPPEQ